MCTICVLDRLPSHLLPPDLTCQKPLKLPTRLGLEQHQTRSTSQRNCTYTGLSLHYKWSKDTDREQRDRQRDRQRNRPTDRQLVPSAHWCRADTEQTHIFISASMAWILLRRLLHSSLRARNSAEQSVQCSLVTTCTVFLRNNWGQTTHWTMKLHSLLTGKVLLNKMHTAYVVTSEGSQPTEQGLQACCGAPEGLKCERIYTVSQTQSTQ